MAHEGSARLTELDLTEFKVGWRIALLAMLGVAANSNAMLLYAWGTLVLPLSQAQGWARADLQGAVSFMFLGSIVGSQIVGWLNLRFGFRPVTYMSLVSLTGVYLLMSRMGTSLVELYVLLFMTSVASMGTMHVTWTHLINLWYERNRGLALAIVLSGTGLAAIVVPTLVSGAISRWGWPSAFWVLACYPVGIVLPLAIIWMREPIEHFRERKLVNTVTVVGAAVSGMPFWPALRSARFWALNLALSLVVGGVVAMVTNTVPMLRDKGLDAAQAAAVFGSFGVSLIAGRMVVGYLVDRLWAPGVAAVALTLPAIGCQVLAHTGTDQTAVLALGVMLVGIGAGAEFDIAAFLMARYFGLRDYGRLFGIHLGIITVASTSAPWVAGVLFRQTGSFQLMLTLVTAMFFIGAMMLLPLGRYPRFVPDPAPSAAPGDRISPPAPATP